MFDRFWGAAYCRRDLGSRMFWGLNDQRQGEAPRRNAGLVCWVRVRLLGRRITGRVPRNRS